VNHECDDDHDDHIHIFIIYNDNCECDSLID